MGAESHHAEGRVSSFVQVCSQAILLPALGDLWHVCRSTSLKPADGPRMSHHLIAPMSEGGQNESASLSHAYQFSTSLSLAAWGFAPLRQAMVIFTEFSRNFTEKLLQAVVIPSRA